MSWKEVTTHWICDLCGAEEAKTIRYSIWGSHNEAIDLPDNRWTNRPNDRWITIGDGPNQFIVCPKHSVTVDGVTFDGNLGEMCLACRKT